MHTKRKAARETGAADEKFISRANYTETDPLIGWFSLAKSAHPARPQKRGKEGRR